MNNSLSKKNTLSISKFGIYIAFAAVFIIISIATPNFLTGANMMTVLRQISFNGMVALGMTFIIITGGIDLSAGAMLCLAGLVSAHYSVSGAADESPILLAILAGVGVAALFGLINGLLIAKGKLPAFIVTMGIMTIIRGISLVYSDGRPITNLNDSYKAIGQGFVGVIPTPVVIFIVLIVLSVIVLHYSKFGRHVYAVGGNNRAAVAAGINADRVRILAYVIGGVICGIAGVALTSRLNAASPQAADGYELDAIAAAVIGGCSLSGGRGNVLGTIIGALLIGVIGNGLDILNVSSYYQQIVKGCIIVIAVFLDRKNNSEV
ncbi:ABC transporter permease [Christensenella intestinihominis]|uniref:ABC transporter permease n=1 Tax=Christensenella intestinihominis TaxID=1851429 RepID=UPI00082E9437|nr:ABC transporter permease [Christensenella intestinihominis]